MSQVLLFIKKNICRQQWINHCGDQDDEQNGKLAWRREL